MATICGLRNSHAGNSSMYVTQYWCSLNMIEEEIC